MEPLSVVIRFDVFEDQVTRGASGQQFQALVLQFGFKRAPEGFHDGVVVAVCFAAHAGNQSVLLERLAVGRAGILHATIGVVDDLLRPAALLHRHLQRRQWQAGFQGLLHGPADQPSTVEIQNGREVKPPFGGGQIGNVLDPDLVDAGRRGLIQEQVRRDRMWMTAVRGARLPRLAHPRPQALLAHETFHPLVIALPPALSQCFGNARAP